MRSIYKLLLYTRQFIHKFLIRSFVVQKKREGEILFHVQLRDQIEGLEDKTDVLPPKYSQLLLRHGKDIFPINPDLREEVFDLVCFKYKRHTDREKESIYWTYFDESSDERSGPAEDREARDGTA